MFNKITDTNFVYALTLCLLWITVDSRGLTPLREQFKLAAPDSAIEDIFGRSVSISGDTVAVGAPFEDSKGSEAGAVYIYVREGINWTLQQKIYSPDSAPHCLFGWALTLEGNTLVVGAPAGSGLAGAVYVFSRLGSTWGQGVKITCSDSQISDRFGISLALSGNTIIIGESEDVQVGVLPSNSVYVFKDTGSVWVEEQRIDNSPDNSESNFGYTLALCGDFALLGDYNASRDGLYSGLVYAYRRIQSVWQLDQVLAPSDPGDYVSFGISLAIDADDALIAAAGGVGDPGRIYTFARNSNGWAHVSKITRQEGTNADFFGASISLDSGLAIVGAPGDGINGSFSGSAYILSKNQGEWRIREKMIPSDGAANAQFGVQVGISAGTVVVGASHATQNAITFGGAAYIAYAEKRHGSLSLSNMNQVFSGSHRVVSAVTEPSGLTVDITYDGSPNPPANAGTYAVVGTINDLIYQGSVTGTLEIGKASQAITFGAITDKLTTASVSLTATGGGSANPVTFAVTSGPGLITNNVLTFTTSGSVTITASQAGNANYLAAEDVSRTFTVTKAVAPLALAQLTQVANGTPRPVSVSTTPSGLTVTTLYASSQIAPTLPGSYTVTSTIEDPIYQGTASASLTVLGLTGLEQPLLSGSTSPLANNGTDYGNVTLGRVLTRVFTLSNPGSQPVTLSGNPLVEVEGDHAGDFQVSVLPEAVIPAGGSVSFELRFAPTQPGARTAQVKLACASLANGPITFAVQGFGALPAPRPQTITFAPLAMAYLSQSPLQLTATASSGLPVSLQVISGPATLSQDGLLTLSSAGTVRVEARQAGNGSFAAAPAVLRTITVKADPTTLTLVDLIKTYNGQPQEVGIVGAPASEVTVTYRVGTTFREEPPVNAGSYAVRAIAGAVTKTGTLVINPAPLVVTAENKRRLVGEDNPPITVLFEGFIGEDTLDSVLERPITRSTTATKTSPVGSYPITSSGGVVKPNYRLVHRPGTLVVEGVAGSYEALLRHPTSGLPNGHLALTVPGASRTFTATLRLGQETAPIPWSGSLLLSAQSRLATATVTRLVGGVAYELKVELSLFGELSVEVRRAGELVATAEDGIRLLTLATGQKAAQEGMYTAILEPARPAALTVPAGAGWATGKVDAKGLLTLTGRLGDGTSFTAGMAADVAEKPGYRLFIQPYLPARRGSHLGGSFTLTPHPRLAGRSYVSGSDLTWVKMGHLKDLGYRTDFGPVTTALRLDPWQAPSTTNRLATRLELAADGRWEVEHSDTGSLSHGALPTLIGVSATNVVSVVTPQANTRKWKITLTPSTGAYTGSFELQELTESRKVNFSGVLRQTPTLADDLIGAGHYLLPALKADQNQEQKTGAVLFWRPE